MFAGVLADGGPGEAGSPADAAGKPAVTSASEVRTGRRDAGLQ